MDDVHSLLVVVNDLDAHDTRRLSLLLSRFAKHATNLQLELVCVQPDLPVCYHSLPSSDQLADNLVERVQQRLNYLKHRLGKHWPVQTAFLTGYLPDAIQTYWQETGRKPAILAHSRISKRLRRHDVDHKPVFSLQDFQHFSRMLCAG
ncbi:MAG: hypothetical protein DHS20C10_01250 [marine bacterium B5-7]|nr:MAG: hypothetical protein DHS20C10_01250 [marine bacterium B5-7]